jgi:glycosyltransferase involved in cell wall biosynthesis
MPTEKNYIFSDNNQKVIIRSTTPFQVVGEQFNPEQLRYTEQDAELYKSFKKKRTTGQKLRVAYVCNWGQQCGISTYSKFIYDELRKKSDIADIQVFSEYQHKATEGNESINFCWKRGQPLDVLLANLLAYAPDFIVIQHEWGVFPEARHFMNFLLTLKRYELDYAVVMHSVWDHSDKSIITNIMENVIVHSEEAKEALIRNGYKNNISIIPHGCPEVQPVGNELFNNMKTPFFLFGYGFGFKYKGVETAIRAVHYLVITYPEKYGEMLYIYHCSESENNRGVHEMYVKELHELVTELGVTNNVILMQGYLEESDLDKWLRTAKMTIFPYVIDADGVYGSSGAIKIAMSYNIPVIASKSRLFDDVEGSVSRIETHVELAYEIGKNFSSAKYRAVTIDKAHAYIGANSWVNVTDMYTETIKRICEKTN